MIADRISVYLRQQSVGALLGAGCGYGAPSSSAPAAGDIEKTGLVQGTVVSIGPQGFNPAAITVKKGTTVIFLNEDLGAPHQPASNPHPIHTDYPGFDAGEPISPGGSYSFPFNRAGTWRYHDHLNPSRAGTVIVTD